MTIQLEISALQDPLLSLFPAPSCKPYYTKGLASHWDQACSTPLKGRNIMVVWLTTNSAVARQHTRCKALTFHKSACDSLGWSVRPWHLWEVIFTSLSGCKWVFIFRKCVCHQIHRQCEARCFLYISSGGVLAADIGLSAGGGFSVRISQNNPPVHFTACCVGVT